MPASVNALYALRAAVILLSFPVLLFKSLNATTHAERSTTLSAPPATTFVMSPLSSLPAVFSEPSSFHSTPDLTFEIVGVAVIFTLGMVTPFSTFRFVIVLAFLTNSNEAAALIFKFVSLYQLVYL